MREMTTIKVSKETKAKLDKMKRPVESYDALLSRIAKENELEKQMTEMFEEREKYHKDLIEDWEKIQDGDW